MDAYKEVFGSDERLYDALTAAANESRTGQHFAVWDLERALRGPWDPIARPELTAITEHLARPDVAAALARLTAPVNAAAEALAKHGWPRERLGWNGWDAGDGADGPGGGFPVPFPLFRWGFGATDDALDIAFLALTVRARVRHAAGGDVTAAWDDLRAALRLQHLAYGLGHRMNQGYLDDATFQFARVAAELAYMAQEHDLPPDLANDMLRVLTNELGLSVGRRALERAGLESGPRPWLDEFFTDDGRGRGWLVVSHARPRWQVDYDAQPRTRSVLWNLTSPAFVDRATARAELERLVALITTLDDADWRGVDGRVCIERLAPLLEYVPTGFELNRIHESVHEVAARRVAALSVALAAYRAKHGEYPETLAALVPELLPAVPHDPYAGAPYEYRRTRDGTPELVGRPAPSGEAQPMTLVRPSLDAQSEFGR